MVLSSLQPHFKAGVLLCLFMLISFGCSSNATLNPVKGKVMVDGKPAVGASVMFHPESDNTVHAEISTGTVAEDGTFSLVTGNKVGAKAGKYIVTIIWPDPNKKFTDAQKMQGLADAPDVLKGRYASKQNSNLKAEVKSGENNLEPFNIK